MTDRFDVIILGGGNAGFGASAVASEACKSIAFVEERDFGGTCPNRGCTPKKVLVAAAHALHEIERASAHGIKVAKPHLDWSALIDRKNDMISAIPDAMERAASKRGATFKGAARFVAPDAIEVNGRTIEGDNIVVATGSKPRPLAIPGAEHLITSDEVLSERTLPAEVVFIGGGVIALEFAHVYARAGAKVTILEALPRLLPRMDVDAVDALHGETERIGVIVRTGVQVSAIERVGEKLRIDFVHDGRALSLEADRIVNGTGRIANVDQLDLSAGNVAHDGIRVEVDEFLRSTSNPRVWVCGDALVGPAQLSPLATYEGRIVGGNIVDGAINKPNYTAIPSCVYAVPALASVGLTEDEACESGLDVNVTTNDMTGWFSGRSYAETVAWSKVLVDRANDRIVGAHIVGHRSEELIHIFALAMKHGITAEALKSTMFAFPTFSSDAKNLL
ncbi:MAG: NAD(P)/FAD-dependent oxidoreductase [Alphaproteobacteria bacterium]